MSEPDKIFCVLNATEGRDFECLGHRRRGQSRFRQRDITRAFRAARKAGIEVRIDVAADHTLRIIPVSGDNASLNPWDEVFEQNSIKIHPRLS
jgi:hypothetical protein